MTQPLVKHHRHWPVPFAPPLKTLDRITLVTAALSIIFVLIAPFLRDPASAVLAIGAIVLFILAICLWPVCLMRNYWRRPHWALLVAWLPIGWVNAVALLMSITSLLAHIDKLPPLLLNGLVTFLFLPLAVCIIAAGVRKSRSDAILLWSLIALGIMLLASAVYLISSLFSANSNDSGIRAITMGVLGTATFIQMIPLVICLIILQTKGRYGMSPTWTHHCLACNYNLTGTVAGSGAKCPECGKAIHNEQITLIHKMLQTSPMTPALEPPNP